MKDTEGSALDSVPGASLPEPTCSVAKPSQLCGTHSLCVKTAAETFLNVAETEHNYLLRSVKFRRAAVTCRRPLQELATFLHAPHHLALSNVLC